MPHIPSNRRTTKVEAPELALNYLQPFFIEAFGLSRHFRRPILLGYQLAGINPVAAVFFASGIWQASASQPAGPI